MHTRPARGTDSHALIDLLRQLRPTQPVDESLVSERISQSLDVSDRSIIVVEDESQVQAVAVVNLVVKLQKVEARIDEVVVNEQSRGKGYGKALITACEEWAWTHGADTIEFTSRPSREAANGLYQKLGFLLRTTNVYQKERGN